MTKYLIAALMSTALASSAFAADVGSPTKAAPINWLAGYPYGSSGLYAGLITQGGGGSVTASVPGVAPASLTTTSASIGGTVGWGWGSKNSQIAYTIEGSLLATNFNGANQGFSLASPIMMDQTFMIWTPVSAIQSALGLLNIPNPFSNIAPFPNTPGLTASNVQAGIGGGLMEKDMTLAYQGVGSNKVWEVAPMIEVALMEQLSNGSALREFVKTDFPTKGYLFGAKQSIATPSTEVLAGVQVLF